MIEQKLNVEKMIANTQKNWPQANLDAHATAVRLIRAGDVMLSNGRKLMEQYNLSPAEFDTLATLRKVGAPYALTPSELCKANLLSSGGLTKVLNHLEKRDFITRCIDDADKRSRIVSLTMQGITLIEKSMALVLAKHEKTLNHIFSMDERRELNRLLIKFHNTNGV